MDKTDRPFSKALFFLAGLLCVASCGGGSDGAGTCGAAQTCGGDIVGTWEATSSCLSASPVAFGVTECPTATGGLSKPKLSGTTTYQADITERAPTTLWGTP